MVRLPDVQSIANSYADMRADYNAAKSSRFKKRRRGINYQGSGADWHYRNENDYLQMIETARDIDRNDVIVGQAVDRVVNNILQDGFRFSANTGDNAINSDLQGRWKEWAEDPEACDIAGEQNFHDMTRLSLRQTIVDGDVVSVGTEDGQLQMFEGHRLRTPNRTKRNVVLGVLLNRYRQHVEHWITKEEIDPNHYGQIRYSDIVPYRTRDDDGVRQVFHMLGRKRQSQTRGVTSFAPIFDATTMHDDIQFAALIRQQVANCITFIEESVGNGPLPQKGGNHPQLGERTTETRSDGTTATIEGMSPGARVKLPHGTKMTMHSPNVPGSEFFPHTLLVLQFISINIGLPLQALLLDGKQTNFSGWRGAMDQAKLGFRAWQTQTIGRYCSPTYIWKLHQWMDEDAKLTKALMALQGKGHNIYGHKFNPQRWSYVEPVKDLTSKTIAEASPTNSLRRVAAEDGLDFEDVVDERIADHIYAIKKAKQAAAEINQEFKDGQPVEWREIWQPPALKDISFAIKAAAESEPDNTDTQEQPSNDS